MASVDPGRAGWCFGWGWGWGGDDDSMEPSGAAEGPRGWGVSYLVDSSEGPLAFEPVVGDIGFPVKFYRSRSCRKASGGGGRGV